MVIINESQVGIGNVQKVDKYLVREDELFQKINHTYVERMSTDVRFSYTNKANRY